MTTCRECKFATKRYQHGSYPDGVIDPNYIVCSWLQLNRKTLPDSAAFLANHYGDLQNAHSERDCPCFA
jgi:hypothetical protein